MMMKSRPHHHVNRSSLAKAAFVLMLLLSGNGIAATGDFDGDGQLGHADINLLSRQIRRGSNDLRYDVNDNGSVDGGDHHHWVFGLKRTGYGDANFDYAFDSRDLVQVFQIAEYEDVIPLNSGWEDGDWDGDGEFTSGDFIVAFTSTNSLCYERSCWGPRPAETVPEPCSFRLFVIMCVVFGPIRNRKASSKTHWT